MTERRTPPPSVPQEDAMHMFDPQTGLLLAAQRRQRLLDEAHARRLATRAARRRRLRRRPVALPTQPPDAA